MKKSEKKKKEIVEVLKPSGSPMNCGLNFSTRVMADDLDPAFSLLGISRLGHQTCRGWYRHFP